MSETETLWVDYHCHLDLYQDYEAQFRACNTNRIATFAVTTTPRAWPRNKELASASQMVRVGLGIHPQLAGPNYKQELALFEKYLPETRYVGEVGLDAGPAHYKTYQRQKLVFETVIRLSCPKPRNSTRRWFPGFLCGPATFVFEGEADPLAYFGIAVASAS